MCQASLSNELPFYDRCPPHFPLLSFRLHSPLMVIIILIRMEEWELALKAIELFKSFDTDGSGEFGLTCKLLRLNITVPHIVSSLTRPQLANLG